jgi:uncharacterized protein (DUF885 family)
MPLPVSGAAADTATRTINSRSADFERGEVRLAREGLAKLPGFDRSTLTETERLSADLMQDQLEGIVEGAAFSDYSFPLAQSRCSILAGQSPDRQPPAGHSP